MTNTADSRVNDHHALRRRATVGAALLMAQSLGSRVVLFGVQLLLAWLLMPEDFGINALAATISTAAWSLVGFGVDEVLVQRGRSIRDWEKIGFLVSVGQGVAAAVILVVAAPFVAALFNAPQIEGMLWLSALALLIASLSVVSIAKVNARMDFAWVAGMNIFDLLLVQSLIVLFAWMGFGPYAFFLPGPVTMLCRTVLFWWRAPPRLSGRYRPSQLSAILVRGAQVFGGRISQVIMQQADYVALGLVATASSVGVYAFAYRLAAVPVRVVATSLQAILFPTFASVRSNAERRDSIAIRAAEAVAHFVVPMCLIQAAVAEPFLTMLFGDKWEGSLPFIYILSLGLPSEATYSVARSRLNSAGEFNRSMRYAMLQAVIFIVAVTAGAMIAQGLGVAVAVAVFYLTVIPVFYFRVFTGLQARPVTVYWQIFIQPVLLTSFSIAAAFGILKLLPAHNSDLVEIAVIGFVSVGVYGLMVAAFCPRVARKFLQAGRDVLGKITRPSQPVPTTPE